MLLKGLSFWCSRRRSLAQPIRGGSGHSALHSGAQRLIGSADFNIPLEQQIAFISAQKQRASNTWQGCASCFFRGLKTNL